MNDFFKNVWQMIVESNLLNVAGAVLVLLIGWLAALYASKKISDCIRNVSAQNKTAMPDGTEIPKIPHTDTLLGKVVFYIIILFAVLGCFSILNLSFAAAPLQEFVSTIAKYTPNLIGAMLLAIAAWIVAGIARAFTKTVLTKSGLHERLAAQLNAKNAESIAEQTAKTVYCIVFIFFLPAVLNALKIYGITEPLQAMFEKILTFVPNILSCAAILLVGLWAASLIRKAVSGVLVISRLDSFGEKIGISKCFGNNGLASMVGIAAYVLVAIPVVISGLTALKIEALSNSVAGFYNKILNASGDIIGACLLVFIALLAGRFLEMLTTQLTAGFGFDRIFEFLGFIKDEKIKSVKPSVIAGKIVFLAILVLSILSACEILGFVQLARLISRLSVFGGNLLISVIVLLIGLWLAHFVASMLEGKCGSLVISGVRVCVVVFTIALAIGNINIGGKIVQIAFTLILGAACLAGAVAFGIGGQRAMGELVDKWTKKFRE